jgi:hypothetical protein
MVEKHSGKATSDNSIEGTDRLNLLMWTGQEVEISRFTKALQDNDGHENFIRSEWTRINNDLTRERAIWGPQIGSTTTATVSKWALDFTEGRYRMRKKIRCISEGPGSVYLPKHTSSPPPSSSSPTGIKSQEVSYKPTRSLFVLTDVSLNLGSSIQGISRCGITSTTSLRQ